MSKKEEIKFNGTPGHAVEIYQKWDIPDSVFLPNYSNLAEGNIQIGSQIAEKGDLIIKEGESYRIEKQPLENAVADDLNSSAPQMGTVSLRG